MEPLSLVMERRMLPGIKDRAERLAADQARVASALLKEVIDLAVILNALRALRG